MPLWSCTSMSCPCTYGWISAAKLIGFGVSNTLIFGKTHGISDKQAYFSEYCCIDLCLKRCQNISNYNIQKGFYGNPKANAERTTDTNYSNDSNF